VGRDIRIPYSRIPISLEDDQTDDESSNSISPMITPGESLFQTLRIPNPLPSFLRYPLPRSLQLLRWLKLR
jgi:hypothetical protein